MTMESEEQLRARARQRAEDKVGFYVHLGVYLVVNAALWLLWFVTSPELFPWPVFVSIFWGIGIGAHAIGTYASTTYTDQLAEKEYQKLKGQR
jgi:hypothetical protein